MSTDQGVESPNTSEPTVEAKSPEAPTEEIVATSQDQYRQIVKCESCKVKFVLLASRAIMHCAYCGGPVS